VKGTSRDSFGRLVLGDIIIGADGKKIKTAADLYRALDKCKVGQNVDLELLRQDSKEHVLVCTRSHENPVLPPSPGIPFTSTTRNNSAAFQLFSFLYLLLPALERPLVD
jgi:PDZ domain-containing secreted protein